MEDVIKIENTNSFDGLYHVLGGAISPLDGIGPSDLSFDKLLKELIQGLKKLLLQLILVHLEMPLRFISKKF